MTITIQAVSNTCSINVIRQLSNMIWGENNYFINVDNKKNAKGEYLWRSGLVYSMKEGYWQSSKETVQSLLFILTHMKGEPVELQLINRRGVIEGKKSTQK